MLDRIANGRTDFVFDYVTACHAANPTDTDGISLIQHCAHHGDIRAIRFLLITGIAQSQL